MEAYYVKNNIYLIEVHYTLVNTCILVAYLYERAGDQSFLYVFSSPSVLPLRYPEAYAVAAAHPPRSAAPARATRFVAIFLK